MTAPRLLKHFDRIAETRDAVPKLRRFILDLAVRGKLVEQSAGEQDSTDALRRLTIRGDRANLLLSEARITPFALPNNWRWIRFGAVHDLIRGVTYDSSDVSSAKTPAHLPIVRANNIGTSLNFDDLTFVSKHRISPNQMLRCGDYLVALSSGSKDLVGKAVFVPVDYECAFGAFCGVIRLTSPDLEAFTGVFLSSQLYRAAIASGSRGIGINNLKRAVLDDLAFPFPPIEEQNRIARRVDELMTVCDRLEAAQAERETRRDRVVAASLHLVNEPEEGMALEECCRPLLNTVPHLTSRAVHFASLRESITNLALQGRLVRQDSSEEPALEQLRRIEADRARLVRERSLREEADRQTVEAPVASPDIPDSWRWVSLAQVAFSFRYGTSVKCAYHGEGVPVLRIPNVANGRIDVADLKFGRLPPREAADLKLQLGDILIVRSNGSLDLVGRPAQVEDSAVGFCYAGYLVRVRTSPQLIDTRYLTLALTSHSVRDQIEIPIRSTVGLKNVNATELGQITFPLAPLAEQRRIVAKLDELMTICDRLEVKISEADKSSSQLLEALLHEALESPTEAVAS